MRAINVLLSIVVSLVIGLLVFEGGLRLIGMGPPASLTRYDADTGWSNRADYQQYRTGKDFGPVSFEFNSIGLRDDPVGAKAGDTFRVIMLGDSFTLGYTVEREDLFVDLLEQRWQGEGRKVEVLNAGVIGWSTDQQAAWLMAHGKELDPDLVVLLPYDNDVFWCGEEDYTGVPKPMFDETGKLVSGELADTTGGWRKTTAVGRLVSSAGAPPMFNPSKSKSAPGDFAILMKEAPKILGDSPERALGALKAMKAECDSLGAELVIAPIPSNSSADADFARKFGKSVFGLDPSAWSPDKAIEFYLTAAAILGVKGLDARGTMKVAHATESCYIDYFGEDREWHFNATGNQAFAKFLNAQLAASLPAGDGSTVVLAETTSGTADDAAGLPFWAKLYLGLWVALTALYFGNYKDEAFFLPPIKVGLLLAVVFGTFMGVAWCVESLNVSHPEIGRLVLPILVAGILLFVAYKLGNRIATISELIKAFILRGHWYLMPLVVVLLTIGSLLVVAASSPLVAPFIYTLF